MTLPRSRRLHLVICAALSAAVAGCGGGSDATGATSPIDQPGTGGISPSTSSLVTQVPAATYAAGSGELAAFTRLNEQRGKCGFGLMAQSAALDRAAAAHRAYMQTDKALGHGEVPSKPGFTGADVGARATAAGYVWSTVGENVSMGYTVAVDSLQAMLDLPYHSNQALGGMRDVGISWGQDGGYFVIDYGLAPDQRMQTAPGVRTYPCDGSTNVLPLLTGEIPSPFPSEPGALWGPTISVIGSAVTVNRASVTGPGGSVAIKAIYTTGGTVDPNGHCRGSKACVIPVPLAKGTSYTAHIEGTDSGVPFTRDFTFQTAP